MSEYVSLRDERIFPAFPLCPNDDDIDNDFFTAVYYMYRPKRHWCLLAEIIQAQHIFRLRLLTKDKSGADFPIAFYLDEGHGELDLSFFKVGHTVAILYPRQHGFLDMTVGIRQEAASTFKVFPIPLADLLAVSDRVQVQTAKVEGKRACHGCGKRQESLLQCARCHLSWYCDKKCQEVGWREKGHKRDCKVLKDKDLQLLFALDWDRFGDFWRFPLSFPDLQRPWLKDPFVICDDNVVRYNPEGR